MLPVASLTGNPIASALVGFADQRLSKRQRDIRTVIVRGIPAGVDRNRSAGGCCSWKGLCLMDAWR